jgi:hypothetical protein
MSESAKFEGTEKPYDIVNLSAINEESLHEFMSEVAKYNGKIDLIVHPFFQEHFNRSAEHLPYREAYTNDQREYAREGIITMLRDYEDEYQIGEDSRLPIILEEAVVANTLPKKLKESDIPSRKKIYMVETDTDNADTRLANIRKMLGMKYKEDEAPNIIEKSSFAILLAVSKVNDIRVSGGYLTSGEMEKDDAPDLDRCAGNTFRYHKQFSESDNPPRFKMSFSKFTYPEDIYSLQARGIKAGKPLY